ncbi:MAG TPA: 6-carboxytetrahydropterin synthase QueD, partial [Betaproteobacteria bacterium]|nr:6-carboxytetrahydropterin synthase QueD [Betaproteobacteria bacterium]
VAFLRTLPRHKTVTLDTIPTAENLAIHAFTLLDHAFSETYGARLHLERVRLYETPNNWADAVCGQF